MVEGEKERREYLKGDLPVFQEEKKEKEEEKKKIDPSG